MLRPMLVRLVPAAACGGALIVALAVPAMTQQPDPPGDNGTIKIDGTDFDDHPNNEPHVGCVFQVEFYGFDEGDLTATVTFEAVPPTTGGVLLTDEVFIGEDPAGGGTDLDANPTYDLDGALAGIPPHPVQGHHVRLTVHAEGSQGADTKHKVFWVEDCGPPPTTSTTTTSTTIPPPTTSAPTTTTTPPGVTSTVPGSTPSARPPVARPASAIPGQPRFTG
jgi:hypothetical protein